MTSQPKSNGDGLDAPAKAAADERRDSDTLAKSYRYQPKLRRRRSQQRLIIYISAAVAVICVVLAVIVGRATEMEAELLRFGIQFS